jgi:HAD superfamily hydrolase (TIGR01509 family)
LRGPLLAASFAHPDWAELDRGRLDEPAAIARMQARLPLAEGEYHRLMRAADASLQPLADSIALLRELSARGLRLFALSNMPAERFRLLRAQHDFWTLFEDFVISGEIGLLKPEPAIYAHALEKFGLAPHEAVFIDDSAPNVEAARRCGMSALLFRDAASCRQALRSGWESE